jgi:23S rRNA maturation-related 3'-5' exoribonuclease YhaM
MTYRNETYSIERKNFKEIFVAHERSDIIPTMAARSTTVDIAVKW